MKQETDNEQTRQENDAINETQEAAEESCEHEQVNLERELQAVKEAAEENYQRYLRAQADFDNFRRRSRQEKEEFAKYASQKLIEGLLPVVDNFERAIHASRDGQDFEALAKGVEMIYRQMNQLLEAEGLQPINAVGQPFNPELHQAVMQVEAEEGTESGVVVEELQKGYLLKDKVIRPSMVKVTQ